MRSPIPIRPERDKVSRMSGVTAQLEAGDLVLPKDAPWTIPLIAELLAFPHGKHDDQVDAVCQLMTHVRGDLGIGNPIPFFGHRTSTFAAVRADEEPAEAYQDLAEGYDDGMGYNLRL